MARALKDAHCQEVWIGAESGSQRVLDSMNKGTKVEEIPLARARLAAEDIRVGFFIQLGYLDEQLEDILATRALLENSRPDDIGVSVAYPLPGTKFYELVKEQLQAKTHWQESNDLEMMFEGTYSSDFYRAVRNLLHDQVSVEKQQRAAAQRRLSARSAFAGATLGVPDRRRAAISKRLQRGASARLKASFPAMADLLLTHGYFLSEDEKERQIMKPYPPLGLLSLSAYLKTLGYSVEVYDSTFGTRPELLQRFQQSPRRCGRHLYQPHHASNGA